MKRYHYYFCYSAINEFGRQITGVRGLSSPIDLLNTCDDNLDAVSAIQEVLKQDLSLREVCMTNILPNGVSEV